MKIPLNVNKAEGVSAAVAQSRVLGSHLQAAKRGDWAAKNAIVSTFTPLIRTLAERRATDIPTQNKLIEAGKQGLVTAIKKFKAAQGADRFQLFALDFIEARMDNPTSAPSGFLARIFGSR